MVCRLVFPGRHLGGAELFLPLSSQDHCWIPCCALQDVTTGEGLSGLYECLINNVGICNDLKYFSMKTQNASNA